MSGFKAPPEAACLLNAQLPCMLAGVPKQAVQPMWSAAQLSQGNLQVPACRPCPCFSSAAAPAEPPLAPRIHAAPPLARCNRCAALTGAAPGGTPLGVFCCAAALTHLLSALTHVWPDDHLLVGGSEGEGWAGCCMTARPVLVLLASPV